MKKSLIKIVVLSVLILATVSCKKKDKTDYSLLDAWKGTYTVTAESYYGDIICSACNYS